MINLIRTSVLGAIAVASVSAAAAVAPKFLEMGKTYNLPSFGGGQSIKILEVDRESGWIKVQAEKPKNDVFWLNTNQIPTIREGAAEPAASLPPVKFK